MLDKVSLCLYNDVMIKFSLRLPEDLYAAIKEIAADENRSINSQIIYILKNFVEYYRKKEDR